MREKIMPSDLVLLADGRVCAVLTSSSNPLTGEIITIMYEGRLELVPVESIVSVLDNEL